MKELTDHLALPPHELALGLCLVTAGRSTTMPLKDTLDQPETMWVQFHHRLDRRLPFCRIAGHTQDAVREILVALETLYRRQFPTLNLHQWTSAIYGWLAHPLLDPYGTRRVLMGYLTKFVTTALEQTAARGEPMSARRNRIWGRKRAHDSAGPAGHQMHDPASSREPVAPRTPD
ncbi:MAG TPA: hypothetical protein VKT82_06185 [Ktedonobacterales bacterium]|nr:hypothetical protein [Ktedonobacterales bacterium]